MDRTHEFKGLSKSNYAEVITNDDFSIFLNENNKLLANILSVWLTLEAVSEKYCKLGYFGLTEKEKQEFDFEIETFIENI